jgi:hypothetical protein
LLNGGYTKRDLLPAFALAGLDPANVVKRVFTIAPTAFATGAKNFWNCAVDFALLAPAELDGYPKAGAVWRVRQAGISRFR